MAKYAVFKLEEFKLFNWCAMNLDAHNEWDRFTSQRSALKWAARQQKKHAKRAAIKEVFVVHENGQVTINSSEGLDSKITKIH